MPQTPVPMTEREREIATALVAELPRIDGGAMVDYDGTWLSVDGDFDMGVLVRAILSITKDA